MWGVFIGVILGVFVKLGVLLQCYEEYDEQVVAAEKCVPYFSKKET